MFMHTICGRGEWRSPNFAWVKHDVSGSESMILRIIVDKSDVCPTNSYFTGVNNIKAVSGYDLPMKTRIIMIVG